MTTLFIIFQIILVIIITIAVLLQKSSSIGLGAYSGSNESLFGAKGPAGFLAKFTFLLGVLLIANTITLSYIYNTAGKDSVAEKIATPQAPRIDANATNSAPQAPSAPNAPVQNAVPNSAPSIAPQAPSAPNSATNLGENSASQNVPQATNSPENSAPQSKAEANSTENSIAPQTPNAK